ncbi:Glycerate dehydrogenase [BD1-7 clade bacterium]|uniref:Glycerate dehydrogenase n=1 Tax=BD1-7 clade bacterium TaxID=2029982 RepID=A0A5S9PQD6_9GAMM|nr:Glycerate dehydrogenase [BD1-7 clade bacterium]CAA0106215.1 Glycerate dehydrogenase [BD1-7 clade bacterium]
MSHDAVILDYASLAPDDLNLKAFWALPFTWQTFDHTDDEDIAERVRDKSLVLANKVPLGADVLKANPQLKLIIIMATGTNNVDLEAARACGIKVCNIVDYSTESVVQHTISLMLALQTRLIDYAGAVREGQWQGSPFFGLLDFPIQEVAGQTLGIIGLGNIGCRVRDVSKALGMNVVVAQSVVPGVAAQPGRLPLEQLLAQSDVVSVHSPLSSYTEGLLDADKLALMKPSAILLNVGRGGIIDERALADALRRKQLRGAGIDVLAIEPPAQGNPLFDELLENLIVTPHSAWGSQQSRQNLINQMVQILSAWGQEDLLNRVV